MLVANTDVDDAQRALILAAARNENQVDQKLSNKHVIKNIQYESVGSVLRQ